MRPQMEIVLLLFFLRSVLLCNCSVPFHLLLAVKCMEIVVEGWRSHILVQSSDRYVAGIHQFDRV